MSEGTVRVCAFYTATVGENWPKLEIELIRPQAPSDQEVRAQIEVLTGLAVEGVDRWKKSLPSSAQLGTTGIRTEVTPPKPDPTKQPPQNQDRPVNQDIHVPTTAFGKIPWVERAWRPGLKSVASNEPSADYLLGVLTKNRAHGEKNAFVADGVGYWLAKGQDQREWINCLPEAQINRK